MKNPPSRFCFGKYDIRELLPIVQKKFVDGFSTVELLKETQNDEEKDKVAIVALLDLDEETVMHMLSDNKNGHGDFHLLSCRNWLKKMLRNMPMNSNNRTDKRINHRMDIPGKCILANHSDSIGTQLVDISIIGLGVKTDRTLPFKNGCALDVVIPSQKLSQAKLMWAKKGSNNTTRLGLKFLPTE